jgi:hypothetical protein
MTLYIAVYAITFTFIASFVERQEIFSRATSQPYWYYTFVGAPPYATFRRQSTFPFAPSRSLMPHK